MARNAKNTRMCAGCRGRFDKSALVRIGRCSDGISVSAPNEHSEGRGVYICCSLKCLELAMKKKSFSRSFKCEIPNALQFELENYVKSLNQE